jgi:protein TonB
MHAEPIATRRGLLRPDWREIGLWSAAGFVVIGVHAGAAWYIQNNQPVEPASDIAAAVMIDIEPLPAPVVAQPVKEEAPIKPDPVKSEPVQQEPAAPESVEEVQPEPEQQIQPTEEVTQDRPEPDVAEEPAPETAESLDEELVNLPKVEVPIPVMRPKPENPDALKKAIEKVVRKPVKKVGAASIEDEIRREAKQQPTAPNTASARQSEKWSVKVQAYLTRRAQRVRSKEAGTVRIAIMVTRGGAIVSASVVGSSGSMQLDQSVLATVRSASPVPAAPDEFGFPRASFKIPFEIR